MKIQIPFDYINILAFRTLLKFENKRCIKIDTLKEYCKVLLEEVISDYKNNEIEYYEDKDNWKGEIEFIAKENDNIEKFLKKYSEYFYYKDETIYLYQEVKYEDLEETERILLEWSNISNRFFGNYLNDKVLNTLEIKSIKNAIEKYTIIEKQLEKSYQELTYVNNKEQEDKIKKLLFMRTLFLMNIGQNEEHTIDAFRLETARLESAVNDYKISPINMELWEKSKYSKNDDLGDIDSRIYDMYQYAIFSDDTLNILKTRDIITNLCFFGDLNKNNVKEESIENEDWIISDEDYNELIKEEENEYNYSLYNPETLDLIFYLNYINKINNYMNTYGENKDLINTKNRLLYSLDTHKLCLYKEEKLQEQLEEAKLYEYEEDDFEFIEDEARFMADEIFLEKNNQHTLKKLLFIATYYDLTKDNKIIKIINKHQNDENYEYYSQIIFGSSKGYSRKKKK